MSRSEIFLALSCRILITNARVRSQAIDRCVCVVDNLTSDLFPPVPLPPMFHTHTFISQRIEEAVPTCTVPTTMR